MFTLKLYRAICPSDQYRQQHLIVSCTKVLCMDMGKKAASYELWAFDEKGGYDAYYVGTPEEGMKDFGRDDLHLDFNPYSWWQWAYVENWEGNTTQTYRP